MAPYLSDRSMPSNLSIALMFLKKLWFDKNLAEKFKVHSSTVSCNFCWVLGDYCINQWPGKVVLDMIMPSSEVFIERSSWPATSVV